MTQATILVNDQRCETIKEDAVNDLGQPIVRKWKIQGEHPSHPGAFIIKNGSTTRLIFPADFDYYYQ